MWHVSGKKPLKFGADPSQLVEPGITFFNIDSQGKNSWILMKDIRHIWGTANYDFVEFGAALLNLFKLHHSFVDPGQIVVCEYRLYK